MATEVEITELRLGLVIPSSKKRVYSEIDSDRSSSNVNDDRNNLAVGWPPVCGYRRKNNSNSNSNNNNTNGDDRSKKMYVKVSMDGAPFLRKVDLSIHKDYYGFVKSLEKLFHFYGISYVLGSGNLWLGEVLKDGESNSSEYIPIYEDKDGDWMLVGDVPWEMFCESCKRLRIMKRSDAKVIGLRTEDFLKGVDVQREMRLFN